MSIYLVDYENTRGKGLAGVELLEEDDEVVVFYSCNCDTMTFELYNRLLLSKAQISNQKAEVGSKNALDFQLSTYLGFIISQDMFHDKTNKYYIVSKDLGFRCIANYWRRQGFDVSLLSNCRGQESAATKELVAIGSGGTLSNTDESDVQTQKNAVAVLSPEELDKMSREDIEQELAATIVDCSDNERRIIAQYICKYKTKQTIKNKLDKLFKDSKRAGYIYQTIKPLLTNKK